MANEKWEKGMKNTRVRVIHNRHCSAVAAVRAWLDGSLWGDPITVSNGNIHVYGLWRKRRRVNVQFTAEKIVVVRF